MKESKLSKQLMIYGVLSLVIVLSSVSSSSGRGLLLEDDKSRTLGRLSSFVRYGTEYLTRVCHTAIQDPDHVGKFTYVAYLDEELPLDFVGHDQEDYNLLRHNGAIYSLGLSYGREPNEVVLETMKRSVDFLKTEAIGPVPDATAEITDDDGVYGKRPHIPNLLAAWETSGIVGHDTHPVAKLGGAGLALVSLVSLEQVMPGSTDMDVMRQIGDFIHFLQKEDGSFYCRYRPHHGGKDDSFTSLYYPGEASLGLLYLASIEENEEYRTKWIETAKNALLYLEDLRRTKEPEDVEPDHWALLATAAILPHLDEETSDYWRIYRHGIKVVMNLVTIVSRDELVEYAGCHTHGDGRTCPTSTRLEGLMAAMKFVREDELFVVDWEPKVESLRDRMLFFVQWGADFLLASQQDDTSYNMLGAVPETFPAEKRAQKEVRIDYVQHSMSGIIAYEKYLLDQGNARKHMRRQRFRSPSQVGSSSSSSSGWFFAGIFGVLILLGAAFMAIRKPKKTRVL